jgi:hypothetical protein
MANMIMTEWSQRGLCHGKGSKKNNFVWDQIAVAALLLTNAATLTGETRPAAGTTIMPSAIAITPGAATVIPGAATVMPGAATVMPSVVSASLAEIAPPAEVALFRLATGEVVELVQSIARLNQLMASDAELRGDVGCVVAVDCEGAPESLHLIQLAFIAAGNVSKVIVLDGVKLGGFLKCANCLHRCSLLSSL